MDVQSTAGAPLSQLTRAFITRKLELVRDGEFVLNFVDRSDRKRSPLVDVWDEVFENYLVLPAGELTRRRLVGMDLRSSTTMWRDNSGGNMVRLKDPTTHAIVETLAAQAIGLLFSSREYIQAIPIGADDPEKARLISRLLMAVLEQPGTFRTFYQAFKDAFIFGTSILEFGWETRSRMQWVPRPVLDAFGRPTGDRELVPGEVIYRDRPLPRQLDHYNFYPDPTGTSIHGDMLGVAKRFTITAGAARRLLEAGTYTERDAVERAIRKGGTMFGAPRSSAAHDVKVSDVARALPVEFQPLVGFEYWGEVPLNHADGASNRVVTVLNGEVVRSYMNPFIGGALPFKEIVINPVSGRFWGLSPAEVVRFLQDSTDHYLMTMQAAANMAVRGPILVGRGYQGDLEAIRNPGVNEPLECVDPKMVMPLQRDMSALAFAQAELLRRQQLMNSASGANGQLLPMPSSTARGGATEISEIVRLASQRGEMMIRLTEKDDFPHIGRTFHNLLRQFTEPGDEILAVYAGERFAMTLDDIDIDADIRFVGSRQAESKFQKVAALKEAITVLSTNPDIVAILPGLVVRYMRDGLDIEDADSFVAAAEQALAAMKKAEAADAVAVKTAGQGRAVSGSGTESNFGTRAGETERGGQRLA